MKTLEAAIDYAHMIVPMIDESDTKEMWRSIEYYLTSHKKVQPVIEKIALGRIEDVIDTIDNLPLTWDELRTMEGKPVWVEYGIGFNQKRWVVINSFHNTGSFCYMDVSGNYPNTFWQKDMGEDEYWQAYRKEKK